MPTPDHEDGHGPLPVPLIGDQPTWDGALAELRTREKAATRELDVAPQPSGIGPYHEPKPCSDYGTSPSVSVNDRSPRRRAAAASRG